MKKWLPVFVFIFTLFCQTAHAHSNNTDGFSTIEVEEKSLRYELQLDLLEMTRVVDLGINQNRPPEIDEIGSILEGKKGVLQDFLNANIKMNADGIPLKGEVKAVGGTVLRDRLYAIITIAYPFTHAPSNLTVQYNVFFDDNDQSHVNYAKIIGKDIQREFVFSSEEREFQLGHAGFLQKVRQFLLLGLEHIFTGYDHILFMISLLFGMRTIRNVLSLVTAFTIAHSVTLTLATLQFVSLPSMLVESAIALSIIYVALQNMFNQDSNHHPWMAFAFGLIHGFGFAGILSEMRINNASMAVSLLSFNVGIELGQLLIVAFVFPIILWIRKKWTVRWFVPGTSTAILLFGLLWFVQRAFPWKL